MREDIHIRGGFDIVLPGAPEQRVCGRKTAATIGITGRDLAGMRPAPEVAAGDTVACGQVLFRDRARPRIAVTSPSSGRVRSFEYGRRRTLSALVIDVDETQPAKSWTLAEGGLRDALLASGLWPAFRTRPFGQIPDPDAEPAAILVMALDTAPHAPDPDVVISAHDEAFASGMRALAELTAGPVHLAIAPRSRAAHGLAHSRLHVHRIHGNHPAGMVGAFLPKLRPRPHGVLWTIGYQDVVSIGQLVETGRPWFDRIVSIAGPRAAKPRLVHTLMGAQLGGLVRDEVATPGNSARILAGDAIGGVEAAFLGLYDRQVTVLSTERETAPVFRALRKFLPKGQSPGPRPIVPTPALSRALGGNGPALPLLRAIATGDVETARSLGALDLLPEDLALATRICGSGNNYGAALDRILRAVSEEVGA